MIEDHSIPPAGYKDGKPFWKVADVILPNSYLSSISSGAWDALNDKSSKKLKNNTF